MKSIIQRVSSASVLVDQKTIAEISTGILALVGFGELDDKNKLKPMAEKIANLRIFSNTEGRFDKSLLDLQGELLLVPQFTLYADTSKGRRPEFFSALRPELASPLFLEFVEICKTLGIQKVGQGIFGADMKISLINDGPVTICLEN
jgi:D-aminoacyl-tRNA deacylase